MRTYERVLMFLCLGSALSVPAWTQQSPAAASAPVANPQSTTPPTPDTAPPPKKKKKAKADPLPAAPVAPEDMCLVKFHTEVLTQGGVSFVSLDISPMGPGTQARGTTGSNGDFETKLAPGDYQVTADLGQVTARQNIHVPKGGTTVVIIEMPPPPQPTIPTQPSQGQFPR
jgi:hypothetical protein